MDPRYFSDEQLDSSQRNVASFRELPAAHGTPDDVQMVERAIDVACEYLDAPAPAYRFVYAPGRSQGQAEQLPDGSCLITLNLAELRTLRALAETTCHEAQHCADMRAGLFTRLSAAERERRAVDFAGRVMDERGRELEVLL